MWLNWISEYTKGNTSGGKLHVGIEANLDKAFRPSKSNIYGNCLTDDFRGRVYK